MNVVWFDDYFFHGAKLAALKDTILTYCIGILTYICNMNLYIFDHVQLVPERQIALHSQESWELTYVLTGCGEREVGNETARFVAGDLVLIPPGVPHCWHFNPQCADKKGRIENITIIMEEVFLDKVKDALPALSGQIEHLRMCAGAVTFDPEETACIARLLRRMCDETESERAVSMVELLYLVSRREHAHTVGHYRKPDINRQRLMQVRVYVSCNYHRPISLDEISRHIGMNRSAFCTFFHKHAGQTFVDYLNAYRVNVAHRLLQWEGATVAEACFACGFNDTAYFSRTFRRYKGFAPSRVRSI